MKEQELYQRALDLWGRFAQEDMLLEEMREVEIALILHLLKATSRLEIGVLKLRRSKTVEEASNRIIEIAKETADVEIMLEQIKLLYKIEDRVKLEKRKKLDRLEGRIKLFEETQQ